jgi:uncharacterized membrane protein
MVTPLLMLLILVLPFLVRRFSHLPVPANDRQAAAWGLGLLFLFTASGHFLQANAMVQMLPAWVPARKELVHATGVLEIAVALAVLSRRWRTAGAWAALIVLVVFFPANIHAALQHAPMGGHAWGPSYLLIRAPLQLFICGWIWLLILRPRPVPAR